LAGSEEGFSSSGLAAYNRIRERYGLAPGTRVIRGPLDTKNPRRVEVQSPKTGERPASSTVFPDRGDPVAVKEWIQQASPEDKRAFLNNLKGN